jgi:hypothetical protein
MTSMFDSDVRDRRDHTEWAVMSLSAFMRDMAITGNSQTEERGTYPVTLTCHYRHSVASRYWWTITWTDEHGVKHEASAQELDLCLWRAAEMELRARKRQEQPEDGGEQP